MAEESKSLTSTTSTKSKVVIEGLLIIVAAYLPVYIVYGVLAATAEAAVLLVSSTGGSERVAELTRILAYLPCLAKVALALLVIMRFSKEKQWEAKWYRTLGRVAVIAAAAGAVGALSHAVIHCVGAAIAGDLGGALFALVAVVWRLWPFAARAVIVVILLCSLVMVIRERGSLAAKLRGISEYFTKGPREEDTDAHE